MSFTRGPWTLDQTGKVIYSSMNDCTNIARINDKTVERKDNAHLIAAAPGLPEACTITLTELLRLGATDNDKALGKNQVVEQLKKSIAKAQGKAEGRS